MTDKLGDRLEHTTGQINGLADAIGRVLERKDGGQSTNTITINLGGVTSAIAVCMGATAIIVGIIMWVWSSVQLANMQSEMRAWVQVISKAKE